MEGRRRIPLRCRVWPGFVRRTSTTFLRLAALGFLLAALPSHSAPTEAPGPAGVDPADRRQAGRYLENAVDSYRKGLFQQSGFYLRAARRLDPALLEESATAFRVEAHLLLAEDNAGRAMEAMVKAVRRKPDPFLYYLIGNYNLGLRSLRQARNAFRAAVTTHDRLYERGTGRAEGHPLDRYLPFACPTQGDEARVLEAHRTNAFASGAQARSLWGRDLHPAELALAAYQWLTLTRHLDRANSATIARARAAWTAHRGGLDSLVQGGKPSPMVAVVRAPDNRDVLGACLRELGRLEASLRTKVELGSTSPTQQHLQVVHELQRRVYRNAVGNFGELRDYYMYGTHALRHGNPIEALHALRRALERADLQPGALKIEGDVRQAALVYRGLELVYRKLNRGKDADTVADFARNIEEFLTNVPERESAAAAATLQRRLLRTSRLFLYNREGLALLLGHARSTGDEKARRFYTERLKQRDRKYEYSEMLAAFPDL